MNHDDDQELLEPPKYDMLTINFMGDNHDLVLPYCEVANGELLSTEDNQIKISVSREGVVEEVSMGFDKFVELVESTFDTKGITQLLVQRAGTYDVVKIL